MASAATLALETPDCPLCGDTSGKTLFTEGRFSPYGVRCCVGCGLNYLSPRPREDTMLAHYAGDDYFEGSASGYADYAAQESALRATFRRLLGVLRQRGLAGGSLLEVGCGHGYLLDEARAFFSRRVGTDYSSRALAVARPHADVLHLGGVDAVPAGEAFDCVMALHVIEHTYHPQHFVRSLLAQLRPGGRLLIATPDAGSLWRTLMGAHWPSYKVPEHVLYLDRRALTRLLEQCGVANLAAVPYPHAFALPLIASKLGLKLPAAWARHSLWLPGTTLALCGFKPNA